VAAARPEHEQVLGHLVLPDNVPPAPRPPSMTEATGIRARRGFAGLGGALRLTADGAVLALTGLFRRGPRGRYAEAARLTGRYGAEGVPIVALLSLLLGLALGFQAAYQLRQFGASLFIANLVGLSVLRELGPVLTAVIVIGRTGSAITAELGTMVVREEVDALRVMGLDPVRFLVVPRLYALTIAMPALTLFANVAGMAGGLLIADFYLRISPSAYIHQTLRSVVPFDLLIGLFKSFLFAWVIAFVSVAYGLSPKRGAESVGQSTTASVVTSIFLLIVVDSTVTTLSTLWKGT
jgi:phospholipid/cholesterol/gamma-HCH transport system permease protein